ncbi:phosphatidate cytidylyltransferase [Epibacterium sp. SM1979]|uniref:Phosphatidate cytidylyltransferase n=1 Tax=Tritonibacter litoralis TaxID=2662264 RepID=A0A843YDU1_9RHOB|nr:phosphatidate cytidylyltransferase [Tritonibacter litoralis]MQQ07249.1 phosphatidate cytidylyltransferase [Tritonibacter litoralis]
MTTSSRWADLGPRVASAIVMLAIAGLAIWSGGLLFNAIITMVVGGIFWELAAMFWPGQGMRALKLGGAAAVAFFAASLLPTALAVLVLLAPVALLAIEDKGRRAREVVPFGLWIMAAGFGFVWLRNALNVDWLLWLIAVVVATDVAGYFAGKIIGGRKFWPRISPKKTWAGTSAGWIAAAVVGVFFTATLDHGFALVVLSVLISMASQAGDIAESALKRRRGVKDSSAIIPGHGGLFDRFDGMLGAAALFLLLIALFSM